MCSIYGQVENFNIHMPIIPCYYLRITVDQIYQLVSVSFQVLQSYSSVFLQFF